MAATRQSLSLASAGETSAPCLRQRLSPTDQPAAHDHRSNSVPSGGVGTCGLRKVGSWGERGSGGCKGARKTTCYVPRGLQSQTHETPAVSGPSSWFSTGLAFALLSLSLPCSSRAVNPEQASAPRRPTETGTRCHHPLTSQACLQPGVLVWRRSARRPCQPTTRSWD